MVKSDTHSWKKIATLPFEEQKSIGIELLCFQWPENDKNVPVNAARWNPTLPWPDFHFNAKWDRRNSKPQLRWSFGQICLCTVASSNQQLHIVSQFLLIILILPHATPMGIRHAVLAHAREGMRQNAIAGLVGLTRATVNGLLWMHAATGSLVPGKSKGAPPFVWNDVWLKNHQHPAFVPCLPCL